MNATSTEAQQALEHLACLGSASTIVDELFVALGHSNFFDDITRDDIATLGEMSMIDGEPRFASCIAIDATLFSVFSRDSMVRIILEQPALGAKILIKLVTMLSQRLRETSSSLLRHLERSDAV